MTGPSNGVPFFARFRRSSNPQHVFFFLCPPARSVVLLLPPFIMLILSQHPYVYCRLTMTARSSRGSVVPLTSAQRRPRGTLAEDGVATVPPFNKDPAVTEVSVKVYSLLSLLQHRRVCPLEGKDSASVQCAAHTPRDYACAFFACLFFCCLDPLEKVEGGLIRHWSSIKVLPPSTTGPRDNHCICCR